MAMSSTIVDYFTPRMIKQDAYDYVDENGVLQINEKMKSVLVTDESDLSNLPLIYKPGTLAYTAGFKKMWQLDADGTWVNIV